jgi:hypothetical protein
VRLLELTGTAVITDTLVSNSFDSDVVISNSAGALDLQVHNSTFANDGASGTGADVFTVKSTGGTAGVSISNSTFSGSTTPGTSTGTGLVIDSAGTADIEAEVSGCTFEDNTVAFSPCASEGGELTVSLDGSDLTGSTGDAIRLVTDITHTGVLTATVVNNVVGTMGVPASGSASGSGIDVQASGPGTRSVLIAGNTVQEVGTSAAINIAQSGASGGTTNAGVFGNLIANVNNRGLTALAVGTGNRLCTSVAGNSLFNVAGAGTPSTKLALILGSGAVFNVEQKAPTAAVDFNEIDDANGLTPADVGVIGPVSFDQGPCPAP